MLLLYVSFLYYFVIVRSSLAVLAILAGQFFILLYHVVALIFQNDIVPLHVASKWGRSAVITLLADNGANIDSPTKVS